MQTTKDAKNEEIMQEWMCWCSKSFFFFDVTNPKS